jgi:hypothetical protein
MFEEVIFCASPFLFDFNPIRDKQMLNKIIYFQNEKKKKSFQHNIKLDIGFDKSQNL